MVCNTRSAGTAHYSKNKKAIRLNVNKLVSDVRGEYTIVFHEAGHRIDDILGRPSYNTAFSNLLKADFADCVKNMGHQIGSNKIDDIYAAISKELKKNDKAHSISDIIGGITDKQCSGNWGHKKKYWKNSTNLGAEAFAHFFEATARNDMEKLEIIRNAFPKSYEMFLQMIK